MRFVVTASMMMGFWLLLSGHLDAFHIITGILSSLLVAALSADLLFPGEVPLATRMRRSGRFLAYLPWLLYQIFRANFDVAYRVLHPRLPIDPQVVTFPADFEEDMAYATLANSITLTPGTVTLEASRERGFVVHAISKEAADAVLTGEMAQWVLRIKGQRKDDV